MQLLSPLYRRLSLFNKAILAVLPSLDEKETQRPSKEKPRQDKPSGSAAGLDRSFLHSLASSYEWRPLLMTNAGSFFHTGRKWVHSVVHRNILLKSAVFND